MDSLLDYCSVAAASACYGVKFLPDGPENWKCMRCSQKARAAECVLCCLRGGALKPTSDGRWAHIVCAVANLEVYFKNVSQREPIEVSQISSLRRTLVSDVWFHEVEWCVVSCGMYSHEMRVLSCEVSGVWSHEVRGICSHEVQGVWSHEMSGAGSHEMCDLMWCAVCGLMWCVVSCGAWCVVS